MNRLFHAGNIVLFGFGGMILFMSYLVFQCTQNPSVMVNKNYYEQELKYQNVIDATDNTLIYNDSLTMLKSADSVVFKIPNGINHLLTQASVQVYNQSDDTKDKVINFKKNETGIYAFKLGDLSQGNYQMILSMQSDSKSYYKKFNY
jgi:hypothetical protein